MASLARADSMHCAKSSFDLLPGNDDSNQDSGLGDCSSSSSCSRDSDCSLAAAAGPTDFAAMNVGGSVTTQKLSREMASMHIKRTQMRRMGGFGTKEDDEGIVPFEEEDENARDCDSSFTMMPPPALPVIRRVFGDIKNSRINSPVNSKRFSRNESMPMPMMSSHSTGGLRVRKRANRSPVSASPFGSQMGGKRWRVADMIDEDSEMASTSYAPRTHSVDCRADTEKALPAPRHFHRVQSTSILECGIYAHHHEESLPVPLEVSYALPSALEKADSDVYRRINSTTLCDLMREMGDEFEKSYALIDCRYPYEYDGGHIKGATNVFDPKVIETRFFDGSMLSKEEERKEGETLERRIPIFYCEFSQKRGPSMALAVRAFDRLRNTWPHVDHAEMYVLNGGYRGFHEDATTHGFGELCAPFSYIQMEDPKYKAEMDKFRFHKSRNLMSFSSTISRLPQPDTQESKLARRASQAVQGSPIAVSRRASRRALVFTEDSSSPHRPPALGRLPNPQFS